MSLDGLFDLANNWYLANLPVEPVYLGLVGAMGDILMRRILLAWFWGNKGKVGIAPKILHGFGDYSKQYPPYEGDRLIYDYFPSNSLIKVQERRSHSLSRSQFKSDNCEKIE